jgi:hypothetical protein
MGDDRGEYLMRDPATTRRNRFRATLAVAASIVLALPACGGEDRVAAGGDVALAAGGEDWSPEAIAPDPDALVQPSVATMPLVVGKNRIAFGLVGQKVDARFFSLADAGDGRITGELVTERSLAAADLPQGFEHRHADGTDHDHSGPTATVYATEIEFSRAQWWGAELSIEIDGEQLAPMKVPFRVEGDTPEPAFGERVPAIEQTTTSDVDDLALIDSSDPPHPEWHDITVADALELDRPLVIAFATGAFCQTQFCGPVIEGVIGPLSERYGDEAEFIVIEPFDLEAAWGGELVPVSAMAQWGLDSEPWVFVTDTDGRVAGKFQGITSEAEVGAVLEGVLGR